jgi:hypothetical protein
VDRKQGRNAYRNELKAELEAILPGSLFRGLPQHGNLDWTPRMVVCLSVIMFWLSGKTLDEQFAAAPEPTASGVISTTCSPVCRSKRC